MTCGMRDAEKVIAASVNEPKGKRKYDVSVPEETWRSGALQGQKEEDAFFVKCDLTTMTQADIDAGRLICHIGVAPVKPAEFVIFRIQLNTSTE